MFYAKEISKLQAQVSDLTGQLTASTGNVTALEGEKAKLEARIGELEAAQAGAVPKADHEAALKLKADEIADLNGKLEAAEKGTDTKVREKIASAGVPAITRDPAAVDSATKEQAGGAGRTSTTWAREF